MVATQSLGRHVPSPPMANMTLRDAAVLRDRRSEVNVYHGLVGDCGTFDYNVWVCLPEAEAREYCLDQSVLSTTGHSSRTVRV